MESAPVNKCAKCGTEASKRCTGCLDAPEYESGDSLEIFYCSSDCQRQHRQAHKAECNIRKTRKKLLRTAMLMKATFMAYRECVYALPLSDIELRDGELILHVDPFGKPIRPWLSHFPEDATTNNEHKEAAMACDECIAAICLLNRLTRHLLKGFISSIQVSVAHVKPSIPWKYKFHNADPEYCRHPERHVVLLVKLGGERWVIDVTGCQFGFPEIISPYEKYCKDRVHRISEELFPYIETETSDLNKPLPLSGDEHRNWILMAHRKHERAARRHLAALIEERFIDGPQDPTRSFFDSTQEGFRVQLDRFVADVKEHMTEFIRRAQGKEDPDN
ncbi:hypothetical protein F5Y06DRAFT_278080 [Hypoxylon sp. FL0890]|nr:hypothetical protein F5Y06DRAFT_278080 [Hypoxylon sp. FL0890]